jgi:hypothetical protein
VATPHQGANDPRGLVVRNLDGTAKGDGQARWTMERICRTAGLPVRDWHTLRHSFGTHAAWVGVNPWRLQTWMGHKRIDETMLCVHVAEAHAREFPECVQEAALGEAILLPASSRCWVLVARRGKSGDRFEGEHSSRPRMNPSIVLDADPSRWRRCSWVTSGEDEPSSRLASGRLDAEL